MIFNRRTAQCQLEISLQRHHRPRTLRLRVFDRLSLVQHDAVPRLSSKCLGILQQQAVANHHHIKGAHL